MSDPVAPVRPRLDAVDLVRGIIMIIMALDHTRDFFGVPGTDPTNLATATPALFLTRWITNICAPVFFLLTGTGARLSLRRKTPSELSGFLVTRGLWLIVAEIVITRCLSYQFNFDYRVTLLIVLWALGWSMIALAVLMRLPAAVMLAVSLGMIAGHNLLDGVKIASPIWTVLHVPGLIVHRPNFVVFSVYPLIPWIGVTAVGFSLGQIYEWTEERRQAFLARMGTGLLAGFVVLRAINLYGDASRWAARSTSLMTVLSFLNTSKYPPSLLFLLMTLGPALLLLRAMDGRTPTWLRPALVIGRVPFFYYVLHFSLIHLLAVVVCLVRYGSAHWMFESPDLAHYPFSAPPGWGYGLPVIYLIWMAVVVMMYPLCRWFAGVKQRRREVWLSYL